MQYRLGLVIVVALGCGTLRKPPEPDRRLDVRTSGALFESNNGYRFAALPEPGASVVKVTVRYPVGSVDDPPGKEGLAHVVEHLLHEIEVERDGKKTSIDAELGRIAMSRNAVTSIDATSYETVVAPEQLGELVRLEVERLTVGCAGLTPAIFAREREVVLNELRQKQGANGAAVEQLIVDALYPPGHPYRRVDSVDSVAKLELADVCGFLVGPYRRGKVMVIASGAVDTAALQAAAGKHLARAPKRDLETPRAVPPLVAPQPGTVKLRADIEEPQLIVSWPLPPMASHEYRMLELAWPAIAWRLEIFGLMFQWGHGASTHVIGGAHAPVLVVGVTLRSAGDLEEAKSAAKKSAEHAFRVVHWPGDDRDSPRWRALWQASAETLLAAWESLDSRNELAANFMAYETGEKIVVGRVEELVKEHPKAVRDIVEGWLAPKRARFVLLEPSGAPTPVRGGGYAGGAEAHGVAVDPSLADKPLPTPRASKHRPSERFTTENGISVVLWPHGTAPLVHGRLIIDSGSAHDPAGKEGTSELAGADVAGPDALTFASRQLATRVDELVADLAAELRRPGYGLADEVKQVMRAQLVRKRAKEARGYLQAYLDALYGKGHPYARPGMTEDSLDQMSRDSVFGWARDHVVPANSILVIAGKFDPALVKKHIAYNTDQVSGGSDSKDITQVPVSTRAFIPGVTTKPSPTIEVRLGFVGAQGIDRDHAKRLVLDAVLGAQLAELRAKRAISYGVNASYAIRRAGGLWTLSGEVDGGRAGEAATALVTILENMRASPESYRSAFVLARQKVIERMLVNSTSSAEVISQLAYLARFDLPDSFYDIMARDVASLTLADFHPFLVKELPAEKQVFGAFGNAAPVAQAIEAARAVKPATRRGVVDPFQ